jgi:hypothetical protein
MARRCPGGLTRRGLLWLLLAVTALSGCARARLQFLAAPAAPESAVTDAGISLALRLNSWAGFPGDLADYYTPLEVRISSQRTQDVEIRLRDFTLLDENRTQYPAIPPAEVAQSLFGLTPGPAWRPTRYTRSGAASLLAGSGPWWPGRFWSPLQSPPFWSPYGYPFPPYADPFAYRTSASRAAYDVLALALREGRLLPGAHLEGFLYFRVATRTAALLTLSWNPTRTDGAPLAAFSIPLRVVR